MNNRDVRADDGFPRSVALGQQQGSRAQDGLDDKFSGHGAVPGPGCEAATKPAAGLLDRVARLRGVSWEWRDPRVDGDGRVRQMGVLAQDVESVFPDAVVRDPDRGTLLVDYAGLVGVLVEAIKELNARLEELGTAALPVVAGPVDPAPAPVSAHR
jgi:hypothetical protein